MRRMILAGVSFVMVAGGQVFAADGKKLPFEISKETTVVTEPLTAEGLPDYIAALNEEYGKGVKPEENGFVAWLKVIGTGENVFSPETRDQILELCGAKEMQTDAEVWVSYMPFLDELKWTESDAEAEVERAEQKNTRIWKEVDEPILANYLVKERGLLKLAEEASKKPKYWMPRVSKSGMMIEVSFPPMGSMRDVANRLSERAMLKVGRGDFSGFLADIGTIKRLARQSSGGPTLIERLVGLAIDNLANTAAAGAASSGVFTEDQCGEIRKFCDGFEEMPGMIETAHEVERWVVLDFAERLATHRYGLFWLKPTDPDFFPFQTVEWSQVDWNVVLKRINQTYDELETTMQIKDERESDKAMKALDSKIERWKVDMTGKYGGMLWQVKDETQEAYTERVTEAILTTMFPSFEGSAVRYRRARLVQKMMYVILDAATEKARTGKWPAEMKGLPTDIYSKNEKAAVKYLVRENGVEVYSVGHNGVDDGGIIGNPMMNQREDDIGVGVVPAAGE